MIVEFKPSDKKSEKLGIYKGQSNDHILSAFCMLEKLEKYSEHFWNNYIYAQNANEFIVNQFDMYILEMRTALKMYVKKLENATLAKMLYVENNDQHEIVLAMKIMKDVDFNNLELWFTEIAIPFTDSNIISFDSISRKMKDL